MDINEAQLISRCQQGDQEALKEIFNQYHQKLYRIAYGVVRHREEALDIVQEVFIKLFRSIHQFKGKSRFYTYLYRMTMNTAIDHTRKMKKVPPLSMDEEEGFQLSDDAGSHFRPQGVRSQGEMVNGSTFSRPKGSTYLQRSRGTLLPGDRGSHRMLHRNGDVSPPLREEESSGIVERLCGRGEVV
jgi:RNA polymerase sigma factor (sigma-70 family)